MWSCMNKTLMICIGIIILWVAVIRPIKINLNGSEGSKKEKPSEKAGTGVSNQTDKNGASSGAAGQQKYNFGMAEKDSNVDENGINTDVFRGYTN